MATSSKMAGKLRFVRREFVWKVEESLAFVNLNMWIKRMQDVVYMSNEDAFPH